MAFVAAEPRVTDTLASRIRTRMRALDDDGLLRTLRAPSGPQTTFASEQIIDMLAIAANMDPYTFRVNNMATGPAGPRGEWQRYTGVLTAAVEAAKADGLELRVSGSKLPTLFTVGKKENSFLLDTRIPTPRDLNAQVPEVLWKLWERWL